MSNVPIVRQELRFEREFGMYRNWWVRDPRIAGVPLTVFLFMHSHAANHKLTPADVKRELQLTDYAWKVAKNTLRRHGFLVEVRDRWPAGSRAPMMRDGKQMVDRKGRPRFVELSGNLRVRALTQDPAPGVDVGADGGVIEIEEPYETWLTKQRNLVSANTEFSASSQGQFETFTAPRNSHSGDGTAPRNSHSGGGTAPRKSPSGEEPQVSTAPRKSHNGAPVVDFRTPHIKEEENQGWLVGSQDLKEPTNQTTRESGIDGELEALAPGCGLTLATIAREVSDRVDLAGIDVVQAARDTLLRASSRVNKPASYIAAVIVRHPEKWPVGGDGTAPFDPGPAPRAHSSEPSVAACLRGEHWWGSERLPEIDRSHCPDCGEPRRNVDPVFAELEREMLSLGGAD